MTIVKKYILILLLSFAGLLAAQATTNRFAEGERASYETPRNSSGTDEPADNPQPSTGNPGDPMPVDQYIPLLLLTAVGLIVLQMRRNKKFS